MQISQCLKDQNIAFVEFEATLSQYREKNSNQWFLGEPQKVYPYNVDKYLPSIFNTLISLVSDAMILFEKQYTPHTRVINVL
jgi:hypothetical protein